MKKLLGQWGFHVQHRNTLAELKRLNKPQLILADYHLQQGENGLHWSEQLQHHWQKKIHTIIISADRTDEVKLKAQTSGCHYIKKPLKPAALRALIDQL
jgi:DNA-binding response OmpR family regulator